MKLVSSVSSTGQALRFVPALIITISLFSQLHGQSPGSLDVSFDPTKAGELLGFASTPGDVYALTLDSGGKLLFGGSFVGLNGKPQPSMARLNLNGSLDSGFAPQTAIQGRVLTLAVHPDGKVLVGGEFELITSPSRISLARFHADGTLDTGFVADVKLQGLKGSVQTAAVQSDGKIIVGGRFDGINGVIRYRLARLNSDGNPDPGFNTGTLFSEHDGTVRTIAALEGGKLLVGGTLGNQAVLHRLNEDGTRDLAFTNELTGWFVRGLGVRNDKKIYAYGQVQVPGGTWPEEALVLLNENGSRALSFSVLKAELSSLQVLPDDRALVTGWFQELLGMPRPRIARLNADGTLDQSFDPAGTLGSGLNSQIPLAKLAADGCVWFTGQFPLPGGTSTALVRLRPDGRLDEVFQSNAPPIQVAGRSGPVRAAVLLPGGEVLVGGKFDSVNNVPRANLARLLPNGLLDTAFQPQWSNGLNEVTTILPQAGGKFLVGGFGNFTTADGRRYDTLLRLNSDGTLDSGFTPPWSETWYMRLHCLALQSDSRILAGGEFENGLIRMNSDGSMDADFHPPTLPAYDGDAVYAIAVQRDGKIIVGGTQTIGLFRLNPDGTPDVSFRTEAAFTGSVHALALQANDMILVGGWLYASCGCENRRLMRLWSDGTVDRSFAAMIDVDPQSILPLADGRILVGGIADYGDICSRVYCLFPDGSLDTNFTASVGVYLEPPSVLALAVQPDARVLIGGIFSSVNGQPMEGLARLSNQLLADAPKIYGGPVSLTRFIGQTAGFAVQVAGMPPLVFQWLFDDAALPGQTNSGLTLGPLAPEHAGRYSLVVSNSLGTVISEAATLTVFPVPSGPGSVDITFDPTRGGKLLPLVGDWTGNSWEHPVTSLVSLPDDRLVIGGNFSGYDGTPRNNLARLHPDGRLDLTFDSSWGTDSEVNHIARQPDGKFIVAGRFNSIQGARGRQVARLNPDGTLDATFNVILEEWEEGPSVNRVWVQQDGKILLFGHFDHVNGASRTNLARLNSDGTLDPSFNADSLISPILAYISVCELLRDDRLLLGGGFPSVNRRFIRLNNDGSIDPSFLPWFEGEAIYALAEQADRKIVVCVNRERILRINADGTADDTFAPAQVGAGSWVNRLGILWDGRILLGGTFTIVNGISAFHDLALLNSNGTLNTSLLPTTVTNVFFNNRFFILPDMTAIIVDQDEQPAGYRHLFYALAPPNSLSLLLTTTLSAPNNIITQVVPQPDGKILFSGEFTQFNSVPCPGLARLLSDGTLDQHFYPNFGPVNYVSCHTLDPEGRILITAARPVNEPDYYERNALGRLNPDGSSDYAFDGGIVDIEEVISTPNTVVLQSDGKILVAGYVAQPSPGLLPGVARFNPDGSLDSSFHPVPIPMGDDYGIMSLGLQSDGKIVLGGELTPARYLPDGDLDSGFQSGVAGVVQNLIVQPDDSLLISGGFTTNNETTWLSLARLHADGSLDPSLNAPAGFINAIARQSDRKILVAYQNEVVRLNPDGSIDPTFPAVKPNNWVRKIALQNDGRILLAGDFSAVNGIPTPGIARLNNLVYPVLRPCAPPAGQTFRLELTGTPGIYCVQVSTNLFGWFALGTVTNGISGRCEFVDPSARNEVRRFYRAVAASGAGSP